MHLNVFWADERTTALPVFPNESGGGFKVAGSKQWGRFVGFGSYTYNTAAGGGFGITLLEHAVTAGVALTKPLDVRGELAVGATWGRPIQNFDNAPAAWNGLRDQYGVETYWKILLTPDLWITPGAQFLFDPSLRPDTDFVGIAQFKFRLFF